MSVIPGGKRHRGRRCLNLRVAMAGPYENNKLPWPEHTLPQISVPTPPLTPASRAILDKPQRPSECLVLPCQRLERKIVYTKPLFQSLAQSYDSLNGSL